MRRSSAALRSLGALALSFTLLGAPAAEADAPRHALSVAAAANLKGALDSAVAKFQEKNPDVEVRVTYGASGAFFAQISNGAPFDVYLAADADYPAKLVRAGLTAGNATAYAIGKLVLWVPSSSKVDLDHKGIQVLLDPSIAKVALGNPAVAPYGVAAVQAMKASSVADAVKGKLVLGESVGQAAQFAESGNAQAAFLPLSLAMSPPLDKEGRYAILPEATYSRIEQAGVILKSSKEPERAKSFLAFLLGADGRAILAKSGYGLPN